MLGKLLKYELKATARLFLPLYFIVLMLGIANKIFNTFDILRNSVGFNIQNMLSFIGSMLYFALIVGILVMTLVIMVQRFYKNLLGDEGYLMFTLPVNTWEHILSKLIVSILWTILSFVTIVTSIAILAGIKNTLTSLSNLMDFFINSLGYVGICTALTYGLLMIILHILMIYSAISLGHLFPKHKLLASFGMYAILYIINQIVMLISFLIPLGNEKIVYIFSNNPTPAQISAFILSQFPVLIVSIIGYFILTNTILKKKLNLE